MLYERILCSHLFKLSGNFQRFMKFFIFTKIVTEERSKFLDKLKLKPAKDFVHENLLTEKVFSKVTCSFKMMYWIWYGGVDSHIFGFEHGNFPFAKWSLIERAFILGGLKEEQQISWTNKWKSLYFTDASIYEWVIHTTVTIFTLSKRTKLIKTLYIITLH